MRLHSVYWLYVYPPRGCDTRKNETLFLFSSLNPRHDANRAPPTSRSARSTNDQFEGPHRGSNCDFTARERGELTHTACTRLAQLVHSSYLSLCFYVHMRDVYVDKFATTGTRCVASIPPIQQCYNAITRKQFSTPSRAGRKDESRHSTNFSLLSGFFSRYRCQPISSILQGIERCVVKHT